MRVLAATEQVSCNQQANHDDDDDSQKTNNAKAEAAAAAAAVVAAARAPSPQTHELRMAEETAVLVGSKEIKTLTRDCLSFQLGILDMCRTD